MSPRRGAREIAVAFVAAWATLSLAMIVLGLVVTRVIFAGGRGDRDEALSRWLASHRTSGLDTFTRYATYLGNTEGVIAVAVVAVVVFVVIGDRPAAWWVALALGLELLTFLAASTLVDRPRPAVVRLNATPTTDSFPSGHSAATAALYGIIALSVLRSHAPHAWRAAATIGAAFVVGSVAFARAYRGMHHVTDVLAGLVLGMLAIVAAHRVVATAIVAPAGARTPARPSTGALGGEAAQVRSSARHDRRIPWS